MTGRGRSRQDQTIVTVADLKTVANDSHGQYGLAFAVGDMIRGISPESDIAVCRPFDPILSTLKTAGTYFCAHTICRQDRNLSGRSSGLYHNQVFPWLPL